MSLIQSPTSDPCLQLVNLDLDESSLQPFNLLPDELLLPIFQVVDPIKRSLLLPICRRWHDFLLSHHFLWNSLVLSNRWSFEESLSILRIFNARSGHQPKYVCLDAEIAKEEDLNKLFEELGKSSDTLRVLSLVPRLPGHIVVRQAKKNSPKLDTIHMMGSKEPHQRRISEMFRWRQRMVIRDSEDDKLKYLRLRCVDISSLGEVDKEYISDLKGLSVVGYSTLTALRSMLMASQSTLIDLDLVQWFAFGSPLSIETAKIRLENLQHLELPLYQESITPFVEMIEVEGELNRLGGFLISLLEFDYPAVKHLALRLLTEGELSVILEETETMDRAAALFQRYNSIEELTLRCPRSSTGGKKDLDHLLKTLLSSQSKAEVDPKFLESNEKTEESGSQEGKETSSSAQQKDAQPEITLPKLVKLTIAYPVNLDGNSLWKLWKLREIVRNDFTVRIIDDEEDVEVNDWEARGWTD